MARDDSSWELALHGHFYNWAMGGPWLPLVCGMDCSNCNIWCDGGVIAVGVDLGDDIYKDHQGQGNTVHRRSWVNIDEMPSCA